MRSDWLLQPPTHHYHHGCHTGRVTLRLYFRATSATISTRGPLHSGVTQVACDAQQTFITFAMSEQDPLLPSSIAHDDVETSRDTERREGGDFSRWRVNTAEFLESAPLHYLVISLARSPSLNTTRYNI